MKTRNAQRRGYDFEARFAKVLGAKPTRGSGSHWTAKMDVSTGSLLVSCKHTDASSFRVTKGHMREIQKECQGEQEPVLAIDVDGEVYIVQRAGDWLAARTAAAGTEYISSSKADVRRATAKVPALLRGLDEE